MSKWGNSKELTQASYRLSATTQRHESLGRPCGDPRSGGGRHRSADRTCPDVRRRGHGDLNAGDAGSGAGVAADRARGGGDVALIAGLTAANLRLAGLVRLADDVLHGRHARPVANGMPHVARRAPAAGRRSRWPSAGSSRRCTATATGESSPRSSGSLLAGMVAAVWSVVTMLVMPAMVLEEPGATAAIERLAGMIRTTWGESLLGSVRIGARFCLLFTLPGCC